jgi:hypothetical protein
MRRKAFILLGMAALGAVAAVHSSIGGAETSARARVPVDSPSSRSYASVARHRFVYPLKVSRSRRYLVDQRNVPFMIVGDAPQSLIGDLSVRDAATYIADRRSRGFNALWVNLLCAHYTGCRADGRTYDGIAPFKIPGDLATLSSSLASRRGGVYVASIGEADEIGPTCSVTQKSP